METARQSAPQPRACRPGRPVPPRVGALVARLGMDPRGPGVPAAACLCCVASRLPAKAGRRGPRPASRVHRALDRASRRPGRADAGVPAVRGVLQPRCRTPHHGADARDTQAPARVDPVECPGALRHARPACRVGEDVGRARAGGRRVRVPVAGAAGRPPGCRARPGPLVCRPDHHVVHQPSARSAKRAAHDGPGALPPRRRPQDVGLLRHLRRARRPLAATGQLPGVACPRAGASHLADQHGPGAARQSLRLRLRLHLGGPARRPHHASLPGDVVDGTSPRALLQLVRHPVARAARASVHLFRGQRQPGRASADAEARSARASRRPDPAATHVRRASPHLLPRRRGQPGRARGRHDAPSEGARRGVRISACDGRRRPAGPRTPRRGEPCAGRGARVGG